MKRKLIALMCFTAMLINTAGVFAEDTAEKIDVGEVKIAELQNEVKEEPAEEASETIPEKQTEEKQEENIVKEAVKEENAGKTEKEQIKPLAVDADKTELNKLIEMVKNFTGNEFVKEESKNVFDTALEKAKEVSANADAEQAAVDSAYAELKNAAENMEYVIEPQNVSKNLSYTINGTAVEDANLSDGVKDVYSPFSKSSYSTMDLVYDLGELTYVTGTDIFSKFEQNGRIGKYIDGCIINVSEDGVNYSKVAEKEADKSLQEGAGATSKYVFERETKADFPSVYTRYIKITVNIGQPIDPIRAVSAYELSEIEVYGFKNPYSREKLAEALKNCYIEGGDAYTSESYAAYKAAYDAAKKVYYDSSIEGKPIYDAKVALENAFDALEKRTTMSVLTKNYSESVYAGYGKDIIQGITYAYDADIIGLGGNDIAGGHTVPEMARMDSDCTKLLQGGFGSVDMGAVTHGCWDVRTACVTFNLGEEAYVSGVDVLEYVASTATFMKTSEVLVSDDGKNFTSVNKVESDYSSEIAAAKTNHWVKQDFDPVKCRYVRVLMKTEKNQIALNEIVLKGFRIKNDSTDKMDLGRLEYKNAAGAELASLDGQYEVRISGKAKSTADEGSNVNIISVAYKNGDIIDMTFTSGAVDAHGQIPFDNTLNLNGENGVTVETYVWDSLMSGVSLSKTSVFGK